ncbi:hypothetical protein GVAV_002761 [Gurleya vavrai]
MSDLANLRSKLDKAISTFKLKNKKTDINAYRAEYTQLLRITQNFTDLQNKIQKDENLLSEKMIRRDMAKTKIEFELQRMKDNIYNELIFYKNVKDRENEDEEKNKNMRMIENNLLVMKMVLENAKVKLNEKNKVPIKSLGLDPTLYKYYSSSDDLRSLEIEINNKRNHFNRQENNDKKRNTNNRTVKNNLISENKNYPIEKNNLNVKNNSYDQENKDSNENENKNYPIEKNNLNMKNNSYDQENKDSNENENRYGKENFNKLVQVDNKAGIEN